MDTDRVQRRVDCSQAQENTDLDRLEKQIDFIRYIDKEKAIKRHTFKTDMERENDAEHAWHMSIMTMLLAEYANEKIDKLRTIEMLLIHDLVEIGAGDTYAYDESAKKTQRERELASADELFEKLPKDQAKFMRELWDEFEAGQTAEARFARTMDNFQPVLLNDATGALAWRENAVKISQILKRNENTAKGSRELWDYEYEKFIKANLKKGNIVNDLGIE